MPRAHRLQNRAARAPGAALGGLSDAGQRAIPVRLVRPSGGGVGGGDVDSRNTFRTARLLGQGSWFLGASTEWPGVVVEIGKLDELAGKYPKVAADLRAIAASVQHVG